MESDGGKRESPKAPIYLKKSPMIFQSKRETPLTKLKAYWALVVEAVKTQHVLEPAVYKRINRIIGYVVFELEWKMLW